MPREHNQTTSSTAPKSNAGFVAAKQSGSAPKSTTPAAGGTFNRANRVYTGAVQQAARERNFYSQAYNQSLRDDENIAKHNEIISYLNGESGPKSSAKTQSYLDEAMGLAKTSSGYQLLEYDGDNRTAKYSDKSWSSVWGDLANILEQDLHQQQGIELFDEKDRIVANGDSLRKRQEYANNVMRSTSATMNAYGEGWSGYAGQQHRNDTYTSLYGKLGKEIEENNAALADVENRIFDFFATDDIKAARQRLIENKYDMDFSFLAPGEAVSQHDLDQQAVDEFMQSIGANARYYNNPDKFIAAGRSAIQGIESGGIAAASLIGKALDSYEGSDINIETRGASVNGNYKTKEEREAEKQRIGLPESQATEDYLAWYNEESAKFNDPNYAFNNSREAFEQENAHRLEALLKPEIEAVGNRIKYLETRVDNASKAANVAVDSESVRQAQEDSAKIRELRKQQQEMEDRLLEAQGLRDKTSLRYKLATNYQNDIFAKMDSVVDTLDAKSQAEILKAKEGTSKLGGMLLDMEKTGLEMGFDMAAGALTGGSSLVPMFIRVMGNESAAARRDGATLDQQLKYAVTKAGIELATEKLFGAFDKIGYGKGIANEMSERIVAKLAETDLGRSVVRAIIAAVEEGAEEGLADILAPIADQMYKDETWKESWDNNTANFWYDVLLGAAMGGLGFAGGIVSGQNTQANQELRRNEANQSIQNMVDYETALEQYKDKVDSRTRELVKYEGMTEEAAKAQAVEEIGEPPQEQKLSAGATAQQKLTALKMMEQLAGENANLEEVDNDLKLTQEEFDSALKQGLVEKADAAKYLATEEAGEVEEAPADTGEGVQSRLSAKDNKTRKVDENGNPLNRMRKLTERMARIAEKLGYGNKTSQSDAYKTATGMTPEEVDAQNNAASAEAMQDAGAQPKGGDASPFNLDNYDQAGINKLWKDRKMTSGQYAEAMVQKGFWSEATARNFLSLVRREGDRLGLNTAEERKRNLGNYTIGQNNAQNAPQGQAVSEGTPAPVGTEKTVKPTEESTETSSRTDVGQGLATETAVNSSEGEDERALREEAERRLAATNKGLQEWAAFYDHRTVEEVMDEIRKERKEAAEHKATQERRAKVENPNKGRRPSKEEKAYLDSADPLDWSSQWFRYTTETGKWESWWNARAQTRYLYDGNNLYFVYGRDGTDAELIASGAEALKRIDQDTRTNNSVESYRPELRSPGDVIEEYNIPNNGGMIDNRGTIEENEGSLNYGQTGLQGNIRENGTGGSPISGALESKQLSWYEEDFAARPDFGRGENDERIKQLSAEGKDEEITKIQEAESSWLKIADKAHRNGYSLPARDTYSDHIKNLSDISEKLGYGPVTLVDCKGKKDATHGSVHPTNIESGIFLYVNYDGYVEGNETNTFAHELMHQFFKKNPSVNSRTIIDKAFRETNIPNNSSADLIDVYKATYVDVYEPAFLPKNWNRKSEWFQYSWIKSKKLNKKADERLSKAVAEEIIGDMLGLTTNISMYHSFGVDNLDVLRLNIISGLLAEETRDSALIDKINELVLPEGGHILANKNLISPEGSGIIGKQSDSAALGKQTARGEEKAVRDSGGTTYVSKTNEERSRIADHQLRDENWDNEINRLLNKDERWDDQDVVTAERAMYKMIRAIRDYQLGNSRKMKKSGFDTLIKRYNDLTTRHINEKSKAGQELQATYQFTPEELVMNRMAKTFLGFAKDGTFAGNTNLAVNAKIYAAAEDAANRITKAAEAKDAKALAQICKDISDIRGVKNMFGAASGFASKVENEILNAIAKQENGVEALQTLALGNLNAICDDVQPYKVVNAAKTIRVMNMLSNMSTIINNITNNIASGLTSTNAVSQGASLLASKAFENITGQTVLTPAAKGWVANKEIRNAEMDALKMATLVQLYGVNQENGKLEIQGDKGLFNPNANAFEQTMAMYKFFIGMGVEATDEVKSAGLQKAMNVGIDKALAKGKITEKQAEAMRKEAEHEVRRLLYKDDNRLSGFVQGVRNKLNKSVHWGNDDIGTIGLGDIAMAFAKIPANVVRARLYATPEGCLVQLAQYTKGVMKAKRMHSEVMARQIMESHATELANLRAELQKAYDLEAKEVSRETKDAKIAEIKNKIAALNRECWNEAREKCSGGVYNKLIKMRDNYGSNLDFDDCVQRCKYSDATEMSQFEAATYSRKIGKAATSAGMVALGAVLRGLGALRDFDQEPDDELRKMYKQKGYSGLMFNWSAIGRPYHEWRDGDIILDADFLEVVAMPLAIGACAKECAMNVEGKGKTKAFVTEAAASGLSKTFEAVGDIPGMADAVNLYNAITSQFNTDNAAKGSRVFNAGVQYLANTLPSFFIPNAYTQLGAGLDNTVRDTYTTDNIWQQAGNIMLNKTAFLRKKIPASVDMWGEERQYGENKFWGVVNKSVLPGDRIKYRQNKYESEIIRLTKEGYKGATPKLSVSGSFEVDGETYTMDADEKRSFKQNRNTEQAEVYRQFMDSPEYDMLTDDQKVAVLKDLKMDCERDAKQAMLNDRGLDVEVTRAKWETELPTTKEQITYLSMKQLAGAAWDSEENRVSDYAAMDALLKDHYGDMTKEMRDILDGSLSQLDKMYDAQKVGINSEMWQKAYDVYRQYSSEEGQNAVEGGYKDWEATEMWTKMEKATGANSRQMNWFEENMGLMRHMRVNPEHYQDLTDKLGWSREASSNLTKAMSELQPSNGNKTVSYKQRLRCIAESKGTTDDQKWEAFYEYCPSSYTKIIRGMTNLRNRGYTYEQALKTYKSGKNSMWWVYENEK